MKIYRISYPLDNDEDGTEILTEEEILAYYWEYWSGRMREIKSDETLITKENCLVDWCIVHWAEIIHIPI